MSTINISIIFAVLLVINCDLEIIKLNDNDAASTATTTKNNKVYYYLFTLYQALCYAFYLYYLILLYSIWYSIISHLNSNNKNVNNNMNNSNNKDLANTSVIAFCVILTHDVILSTTL